MKNVPATRFKKVEIEPFTRDEASHMLKACTYSKEADTTYWRRFVMRPATANRDQAVILTLLDARVCELQNFVLVESVTLTRSVGNWKFGTVFKVGQKMRRVGWFMVLPMAALLSESHHSVERKSLGQDMGVIGSDGS